MSELNGKDINDVISEGMGKLASIPSGKYNVIFNTVVGEHFVKVHRINYYQFCLYP